MLSERKRAADCSSSAPTAAASHDAATKGTSTFADSRSANRGLSPLSSTPQIHCIAADNARRPLSRDQPDTAASTEHHLSDALRLDRRLPLNHQAKAPRPLVLTLTIHSSPTPRHLSVIGKSGCPLCGIDGTIRQAELHWYEAHGVGRVEFKVKRWMD